MNYGDIIYPVSLLNHSGVRNIEVAIYTINIYNTIGAEVYHLKDMIIQGPYKQQVDISSISDGVYMILIKNSEGQKSRRILIKK